MTKSSATSILTQIHDLLFPLDSDERHKVINACWILLGEVDAPLKTSESSSSNGGDSDLNTKNLNAQKYFDQKDPQSKGEELATAVRYLEKSKGGDEFEKSEIESVIKEARRNFDSSNFKRDLENARVKGLFNRGTGKLIKLSYNGQNYIDILPEREELKKLKMPKKTAKRKTTTQKTTPKKKQHNS